MNKVILIKDKFPQNYKINNFLTKNYYDENCNKNKKEKIYFFKNRV